jgi:hypothetical protein
LQRERNLSVREPKSALDWKADMQPILGTAGDDKEPVTAVVDAFKGSRSCRQDRPLHPPWHDPIAWRTHADGGMTKRRPR